MPTTDRTLAPEALSGKQNASLLDRPVQCLAPRPGSRSRRSSPQPAAPCSRHRFPRDRFPKLSGNCQKVWEKGPGEPWIWAGWFIPLAPPLAHACLGARGGGEAVTPVQNARTSKPSDQRWREPYFPVLLQCKRLALTQLGMGDRNDDEFDGTKFRAVNEQGEDPKVSISSSFPSSPHISRDSSALASRPAA